MRRHWLYAVSSMALVTACAGPHSTGALWAQQNIDQEAALFRLGDAQRTSATQAYQLGLADAALAGERARLTSELQDCPGPTQALSTSSGDRIRDGIRLQAQGDATRTAQVARLALADWRIRRARATGNTELCADAQRTLGAGAVSAIPQSDLLTRLPAATVTRDQRQTSAPLATDPVSVTLSEYALGYVDTVRAASPLPQYLAAVYGGFLIVETTAPNTDAETAATTVDQQAAAFPEWEPDALYAALRGGKP
jgi:hypothetical protein